jgi:hypothetical protein
VIHARRDGVISGPQKSVNAQVEGIARIEREYDVRRRVGAEQESHPFATDVE